MSAIPKTLLTPEQYLARERQAEFKSEYYRGEMFAMAGALFPHNRAKENLARKIGNQLETGPCDVVSSDQRVKIPATGLYTYPDIVIYCGEPEFDDDADTLLNPVAIVEVLSESTEKYDRGIKSSHYRRVPSLLEYVLVAQDRMHVERRLAHLIGVTQIAHQR